ncbi:MAG: MBL fold metallo-hydrolase [Ginsengibacter sp.]
MRLKIINSNSSGNAYILQPDEGKSLLIECGVQFDKIQKALNFNLKNVAACLVTHEHGDHAKSIKEVMAKGINVIASHGTHEECGTLGNHRASIISSGETVYVDKYKIKAFDTKHDVKEPLGFLINHPESGNILFLTDSYYCEYTFKNLNNIIVEANYCQTILDRRLVTGTSPKFLRDRVIESHMSLQTCKELLQANDLSQVNNIVLIHLSDGNSDVKRFKKEVEEATGKMVFVAEAGMVIENFNKTAF